MQKIIHRIWLGPKEMPRDYSSYGERWKLLNPHWEVILWTEENIKDIINKAVWDDLRINAKAGHPMPLDRATAVQRADMLSYELVYNYGGMYFNCDIDPLRPMDELLEIVGDRSWAAHEDSYHIVNCAFGGCKGDSFWKMVIASLPNSYWGNPKGTMEVTTGPQYLTRQWHQYSFKDSFIDLPVHFFNYAHWGQISRGGDAQQFREQAIAVGAFGLHHWGHRFNLGIS
jgi:mannosyltransferase OCH1-like enzyme